MVAAAVPGVPFAARGELCRHSCWRGGFAGLLQPQQRKLQSKRGIFILTALTPGQATTVS